MGQKGKMTLSSFLITLLILYLGFVLFKVIETAMTKEQIKSEVKNEIGMRRNSRMTPQDAEDIIVDFLESKNVIFTDDHDVTVNFDQNEHKIRYTFEYEIDMNLLIFRTSPKLVIVKDDLDRHGL